MADRQKRKARRRAHEAAGSRAGAAERADAAPAPRRPRERDGANEGMVRGYARAEARNAAARAALVPLRAGDPKPPVLWIAIVVCVLVGVANAVLAVISYVGDVSISGQTPGLASMLGGFVFAAVVGLAAWGMWQAKYWAILGFQALLAITIIVMVLALLQASNALAVIPLVVVLFGAWLFWKLVNVMARAQKADRMARGLDI